MELAGPVRSWPTGPVTPTRRKSKKSRGAAAHDDVNTSTLSAPCVRRIWSNENPSPPPTRNAVVINPYQVLQIRKDATNQEIRQAYRRLALWHHPGRGTAQGHRRKRDDMFLVLAACGETLLERESRSRCDALLLLQQQQQQQRVGVTTQTWTTPRTHNRNPHSKQTTDQQQQLEQDNSSHFTSRVVLPFLARTFSESSCEEDDDPADDENDKRLERKSSFLSQPTTPPLLWTNSANGSSKHNNNSMNHNTLDDTSNGSNDRDGEGYLSLLYQARHGRPFSDPYDFFERVFGYEVFPRPECAKNQRHDERSTSLKEKQPGWSLVSNSFPPGSHKDKNNNSSISSGSTPANKHGSLVHRRSLSASWTGSAQTLPDGSRVHTTTRILNNRRLVKKEVWKVDPITGVPQATITVTGGDLEDASTSDTSCSSSDKTNERAKSSGKQACCWTDAGCSTWSWCLGSNALESIHDDNNDDANTREYHHYYTYQRRKEQYTKTPPRTPTRNRRNGRRN